MNDRSDQHQALVRLLLNRSASNDNRWQDIAKANEVEGSKRDNVVINYSEALRTRLRESCAQIPVASVDPLWSKSPSEMRAQRLAMPVKLFAILADIQNAPIVSWLPGGRHWRIHDVGAFEEQILPLYFDYGRENYNMFMRLLKLWNFLPSAIFGPNTYYHEFFERGQPQLLRLMSPTENGVHETRQNSNPSHSSIQEKIVEGCRQIAMENSVKTEELGQHFNIPSMQERIMKNIKLIAQGRSQYGRQLPSTIDPLQREDIATKTLRCLSASHDIAHSQLPFPTLDAASSESQVQLKMKPETLKPEVVQDGNPVAPASPNVKFHDIAIQGLENAKRIINSRQGAAFCQNSVISPSSSLADEGDSMNKMPREKIIKHTQTPSRSQERPPRKRRKWLPPLGPASPPGTNAPSSDAHSCDWLYTNAEAFACLSDLERGSFDPLE